MPKSTTSTKTSTTTKSKTAPDSPKPDLDAYLQITREGNPDAPTIDGSFWIGSLNDSGHTVSLYAKSREELEQRATEILASRKATAEAAKLGKAWAEVPEDLVIS